MTEPDHVLEAEQRLSDASEPDWASAFRWTVLAILFAEIAGWGFLLATLDEAGYVTDAVRVGVGFAMGVFVMAVPLLRVMGEGREIARYCLEHHCGDEEEPD